MFLDPGATLDFPVSKQTQLLNKTNLVLNCFKADYVADFQYVRNQNYSVGYLNLNQALENSKSIDSCKEFKQSIDSGTKEDDTPAPLVAKVLRAWLVYIKQDNLDIKLGIKQVRVLFELIRLLRRQIKKHLLLIQNLRVV